jgi:hypothetical protein
MQIKLPSTWWSIFLGIYLILVALAGFGIWAAPPVLVGLAALFAGVLVLFGR